MRSLRTVAVLLCLALAGTLVSAVPAHAATNQKGTYTPVTPTRLLDTRKLPNPELGAGKTLTLQIADKGGVPKTGVAAVIVNLTAVGAKANGYLSAYPTGKARPTASSINFFKGVTRANIATVPLGTNGSITIYNSTGGGVSVLVDVMGFYAAAATMATAGNEFDVLQPDRLVDTRTEPAGPLAGRDIITTTVEFAGISSAQVKALAINITAVGGAGSGYLTAWNGVGDPPSTVSTLNYPRSAATPNLTVVKTAATPLVQFGIYNGSSTSVHVLVDLVGVYFNDGTVALRFSPIAPTRISDSRIPRNGAPLKPAQTQTLTAPGSVAGSNTVALVANAAVVGPTTSTFLTLWSGGARPPASNLNALAGITAANGAFIGLSDTNRFSLYNSSGNGQFVIDVTGRFDIGSGASALQQKSKRTEFTPSQVTNRRTPAGQR